VPDTQLQASHQIIPAAADESNILITATTHILVSVISGIICGNHLEELEEPRIKV
jgi:hypothetical protein